MTRIPINSSDIRKLSETLRAVASDYDAIADRMDQEALKTIAARGTTTFEHHVAKIEGNVNSMQKTLQDAIRDQRKESIRSAPKRSPKKRTTKAVSPPPGGLASVDPQALAEAEAELIRIRKEIERQKMKQQSKTTKKTNQKPG